MPRTLYGLFQFDTDNDIVIIIILLVREQGQVE